jgi:hypothetical protein
MDALSFAAETYTSQVARYQLTAKGPSAVRHAWERAVDAWLKQTALPAVRGIWQRESFRQFAKWPQRLLSDDPPPDEIVVIKQAHQALLDHAQAIERFVKRHKKSLAHYLPEPAETFTELTPLAPVTLSASTTLKEEGTFPTIQPSLQEIAGNLKSFRKLRLEDLIFLDDYFLVNHDVSVPWSDIRLDRPDLTASFNPITSWVGNHVLTGLIARLKSHFETLQEYASILRKAMRQVDLHWQDPWITSDRQVGKLIDEVRSHCLTSEYGQMVQSAMVLVQFYRDFNFEADLAWLGLESSSAGRFRGLLQQQLRGRADAQSFQHIAKALHDFAKFYETRPQRETELEEAISRCRLVVVEETRELFWKGKRCEIAWTESSWRFFWGLVKDYGRTLLREADLYESDAARSTLSTVRNRLAKRLPGELAGRIIPGPEAKSYRLDLHSSQMRIVYRQ